MNNVQTTNGFKKFSMTLVAIATVSLLSACGSDYDNNNYVEPEPPAPAPAPEPEVKQFQVQLGSDLNSKSNALLSLNPGGPGGSSNQSLRAGDVFIGSEEDDIQIGGLGIDVLLGYGGDDILIGGTEDFNSSVDGDDRGSDNRDRAMGHDGDDTFIWAPGDGSDFFDGGDGIDVVIFGVLGEATDADGSTDGAPFFNVNPPSAAGSQDFDGIHLDENSQPSVRVSNSPGFCSIFAKDEHADALDAVDADNVVRFSLRSIANAFDAGERTDDDGTRVAVTLKNTEFVVCTAREIDDSVPENNIEVFDISGNTPVAVGVSDLPDYVQSLIL